MAKLKTQKRNDGEDILSEQYQQLEIRSHVITFLLKKTHYMLIYVLFPSVTCMLTQILWYFTLKYGIVANGNDHGYTSTLYTLKTL